VLVIEASKHQQHLLGEYLGIDGHTADIASDGREGSRMFKDNFYDLVITDRAMPDIGGDKVSEVVKAEAPSTPVIMLTGFGDVMEAVGEKVSTVDMLLGKPATLDQVRRAITEVIRDAPSGSAN
jgi:DNA-binding response OmpR family regulator